MASSPLSPLILLLLLLLSPSLSQVTNETEAHLHFYFHDILSGSSPTAILIAQASSTKASPTSFGAMVMIDDPLTETHDPTSKLMGRAQGFYASASQEETAFLMTMNLKFVDGEYNGSTLAVLGRNPVAEDVREMPVVGGSGRFRFARGYVLAKTYQFDASTGDAIVEYNVFVRYQDGVAASVSSAPSAVLYPWVYVLLVLCFILV